MGLAPPETVEPEYILASSYSAEGRQDLMSTKNGGSYPPSFLSQSSAGS
jgi:hypothetical protein